MNKTDYFNGLKQVLQTVPGCNGVYIWNDNLNKLEDMGAYNLPAIFIEFTDINFTMENDSQLSSDANITLHCLTVVTAQDDISYLSFSDDVKSVINQERQTFIVGETVDHNYTRITHNTVLINTTKLEEFETPVYLYPKPANPTIITDIE